MVLRISSDIISLIYSADHPHAGKLEDQMTLLVREHKADGEYQSVQHPNEPGAKDDYPDSGALMVLGPARGKIGEILYA
jgi:hypothetical protein